MENNFILRIHTKKQVDEIFIIFKDSYPVALYHDRIKLENDYGQLWDYSITVLKNELNFKLKQLPNECSNFKIIK